MLGCCGSIMSIEPCHFIEIVSRHRDEISPTAQFVAFSERSRRYRLARTSVGEQVSEAGPDGRGQPHEL